MYESAAEWHAWAKLLKAFWARLAMPTAQHHDNFAMWDSKLARYNAKAMGPQCDLIGELATAMRKAGMKLGVSNHGIEHFSFINPPPPLEAELAVKKANLYPVDTVSKGGAYLLNISPKADGSIPDNQQQTLLGISAWLAANGEGIYGTLPWRPLA